MRRKPILPLEHAEAGIGVAAEQLARHGEPEDAAADHDEVSGRRWLGCGWSCHALRS